MRCLLAIMWMACWLLPCRMLGQPVSYPFNRIDTRQGLSYNEVNAIYKDSKGFLWFGTMSGLNRYDGEHFRVFRYVPGDSESLSDDNVKSILEGPGRQLWIRFTNNTFNVYDPVTETFDRNFGRALRRMGVPDPSVTDVLRDSTGCYWFISPQNGLYRYDPVRNRSTFVELPPGDPPTRSDNIAAATVDRFGRIWIVRRSGFLEALDHLRITYQSHLLQVAAKVVNQTYHVYADAEGDLWIYSSDQTDGIFYVNPRAGTIRHLDKDRGTPRLNNNIVRDVLQDDKGIIWIATDHGGVNLVDKSNFSIRYLEHNDFDESTLSQNATTCLYKDNTGVVWVGTYKQGINYYHPGILHFPLYRHQPFNPGSLGFDDVNRFREDTKGNLWIGTNGGGLIYFDRKAQRFRTYLHDSSDANSLSNDVIISLCVDHEGKLWIGSYFGGLDCFDGNTFRHYRHSLSDTNSLANDGVWEVFEDRWNQLWVGTLAGGLDLFDRSTGRFIHHVAGRPNSVGSNYISELSQDTAGNLWVGTGAGIDVLNHRTGFFRHYGPESGLSSTFIVSLVPDSLNRVWVGTTQGLNLFDPANGKVDRIWSTEDGLPDNYILTIVEDGRHDLWMGTPSGLCHAELTYATGQSVPSLHAVTYDEGAGLQGRQFNENAAFRTREGELVFGGPGGFNLFDPLSIAPGLRRHHLVFTDLQVFDNDISPGERVNGHTILRAALPETRELTLRYSENVFSVSFADLDYSGQQKTTYSYRLDGFSQEWLQMPPGQHNATFTNLDPGTYVFRVRVNPSTGSAASETALVIHILPPFWRTPLAFGLYIAFIVGVLAISRHILVERTRMRFRIEQERKEARHLHELDMMKIRFFTNVSHEFRTPLSLILAPLEKLLRGPGDQYQRKQYNMIYRNARRLLNLVNQLLDFRKMEVQQFTVHHTRDDIVRFFRELAYSFSDISDKRHVSLDVEVPSVTCFTWFDRDKVEKIVFNLLSNAFKFTPEGGEVRATLELPGPCFRIRVFDTGIGIPTDQQEKVFERFFQTDLPGSLLNQGSGIGLALTKEFVKLHGGTVTVASTPGRGSCFTVEIPLHEEEILEAAPHVPVELREVIPEETEKGRSRKATLLLVEDNEDFRFYLKDNLRVHYHILEASNGRDGWGKVQAQQPDLVVSDIMMPLMDGLQLSRKIKNDPRTCHIPVVLLTARAQEEQQLEGYEHGANDYITKPFNFELLQARVRNLLTERKALHKLFQQYAEVSPSPVEITPLDQQFLSQALAAVEAHLSDPDFSVEDLSRSLHLSRVTLYKKLTSLTGKAPLDFIRHIRLKRAAELLDRSQLTVAEIAYEVGFNNPKYFAKYFKKEYDLQPSAYKNRTRTAV